MTPEELLKIKYQNAAVTNEHLINKYEEAKSLERIGSRAGKKIDRLIRFSENKCVFLKNKLMIRDYGRLNHEGLNKLEKRRKRIIISMTSYPARLQFVPLTVSSLLRQTVKPDKIVVWLGEEKAENKKLPPIFDELKEIGVEIKYRPDIKTHTKWYYAFQEYPHDLVVTVDDDVLYEDKIIEKLYTAHLNYPGCTPALRIHRMRFDDTPELLDYDDWIWEYRCKRGTSSFQFFLTGVGGVMHEPDKLCDEVCNLDAIKKYCESEDDFWLTLMTVLSRRRIVAADGISKVQGITIPRSQKTAMWKVNVIKGGSMKMIKKTLPVYDNFLGNGSSIIKIMALDELEMEGIQ